MVFKTLAVFPVDPLMQGIEVKRIDSVKAFPIAEKDLLSFEFLAGKMEES